MSSRTRVFATSVGTKILIALSGLFLVIYLIIHIAGNLLIFFGPDVFNRYAYNMEERNPVLPVLELLIVIGFAVHIYKAITMFIRNDAARPVKYVQKKRAGRPSRKSFASSTMIFSGLWLVLFLVIHVRAFRFGTDTLLPGGGRDLYGLELGVLRNPFMVVFYVLSMLVVGSHLWHGASSWFQSLGFDHPRWTPRVLALGKVLAVAIAGGFIVIVLWAHLTQFAVQVRQ
jgi:succinate dehydrogenase / fumarate reductase cytochrome b subunit